MNAVPRRTRTMLAGMLAMMLAGCAPREVIYPWLGSEVPRLRNFPSDFSPPKSSETGEVMGGFGGGQGNKQGGGQEDGVSRVPVIFVHGNTVSANYWLPARGQFLADGYQPDELWALSYGFNSVRAFDSSDASLQSLDQFVTAVQRYLEKKTGRPVPQVDIVSHSLGVTLVRQWLKHSNRYDQVRMFMGMCGANHGVWTASPDTRGQNRRVSFELYQGSPWLAQLNEGGETPGPTQYHTLYDGTGRGDVLFPADNLESSRLEGANNIAFNRETGQYLNHLQLAQEPEPLARVLAMFKSGKLPLPAAKAPSIVRKDRELSSDGTLYCATNGLLPTRRSAAVKRLTMQPNTLYTCFAWDEASGLASPLDRLQVDQGAAPATPTLTTAFKSGRYENPQFISLTASQGSFITYSFSGIPNSGSALYTQPIYVAGSTTLTAIAFDGAGHASKPLQIKLRMNLDVIDENRSLQAQLGSAK